MRGTGLLAETVNATVLEACGLEVGRPATLGAFQAAASGAPRPPGPSPSVTLRRLVAFPGGTPPLSGPKAMGLWARKWTYLKVVEWSLILGAEEGGKLVVKEGRRQR